MAEIALIIFGTMCAYLAVGTGYRLWETGEVVHACAVWTVGAVFFIFMMALATQ